MKLAQLLASALSDRLELVTLDVPILFAFTCNADAVVETMSRLRLRPRALLRRWLPSLGVALLLHTIIGGVFFAAVVLIGARMPQQPDFIIVELLGTPRPAPPRLANPASEPADGKLPASEERADPVDAQP